MGLDLTYDADGTAFTHRFSHADWDTIDAMRAHLPNEIDICFEVPELGTPVRIKAADLRESARMIDRYLSENVNLLPATYQFKLERFPVPGVPTGGFDTGGISALRLPDDPHHFYTLWSGLNKCKLDKIAMGADGTGKIVEERDLRGETVLITENAGKVTLRRRAAKTTLRLALREIVAFADRIGSVELTKVVG